MAAVQVQVQFQARSRGLRAEDEQCRLDHSKYDYHTVCSAVGDHAMALAVYLEHIHVSGELLCRGLLTEACVLVLIEVQVGELL